MKKLLTTGFCMLFGLSLVAGCNGSGLQPFVPPSANQNAPVSNGGAASELHQVATGGERSTRPSSYTVTDLGTLGGTVSFSVGVNSDGLVSGDSTLHGDTTSHGFVWKDGRMTDVGTLGGPNSYICCPPNERGEVAVNAETGKLNPHGTDWCTAISAPAPLECFGTLWKDGVMTIQPTLGGYGSGAEWISNTGRAVGGSENTTPDPECAGSNLFQFRPVMYENGRVRELPTIGSDPDGVAFAINDRGQIAATSGTCNESGFAHMYVWDRGAVTRMRDFGGTSAIPGAINALGEVVGAANLPGNGPYHAFLWRKGVTTDLGTLPGDFASAAYGINERTQIVGESDDANGFPHPYLWQKGAMTDLNTLLVPGSPLVLLVATDINDKGAITGLGQTANGAIHPFLATRVANIGGLQGAAKFVGTPNRQQAVLSLRLMRKLGMLRHYAIGNTLW